MTKLTILFAEVKRWLFYRMPDWVQRHVLQQRWLSYMKREVLRGAWWAHFDEWCYGPDYERLYGRK